MINSGLKRIKLAHILIAFISLVVLFAAVDTWTATASQAALRVGVAEWRRDGGGVQDVQQRTHQRLQAALEIIELDVEIIDLPIQLRNAADVDAVAAEYDVDVLVWGWYDEVAVRGYVDLANATEENGMTNSLAQFLKNGGSPEVIRVLNALSNFDYIEDGVCFCVPRWTP